MTDPIQAERGTLLTVVIQESSWQGFISTGILRIVAERRKCGEHSLALGLYICVWKRHQVHSHCISQTSLEAAPDIRKWGRVVVFLQLRAARKTCWQYANCNQRLPWSYASPPFNLLFYSHSLPLSPPPPNFATLSLFLPTPFLYIQKHWVGIAITLNIPLYTSLNTLFY